MYLHHEDDVLHVHLRRRPRHEPRRENQAQDQIPIAEAVEAAFGGGLDEPHAVAGALDRQLAAGGLGDPSGDRVVVHERPRQPFPYSLRRIFPAAAPEDQEDVQGQPNLWPAVEEGQPVAPPRRRLAGTYQNRRLFDYARRYVASILVGTHEPELDQLLQLALKRRHVSLLDAAHHEPHPLLRHGRPHVDARAEDVQLARDGEDVAGPTPPVVDVAVTEAAPLRHHQRPRPFPASPLSHAVNSAATVRFAARISPTNAVRDSPATRSPGADIPTGYTQLP
ncbi:hypothetical protein ACMD2_15060 [Ananas comosus]|uniref:Uncharacterized protein n=1 Tax=Ananas comosus TaxID=4615 RepID=A0A199W369_ANACO|nr:hypothetical protein ACMD2_15060 [Ananas comosus]